MDNLTCCAALELIVKLLNTEKFYVTRKFVSCILAKLQLFCRLTLCQDGVLANVLQCALANWWL